MNQSYGVDRFDESQEVVRDNCEAVREQEEEEKVENLEEIISDACEERECDGQSTEDLDEDILKLAKEENEEIDF